MRAGLLAASQTALNPLDGYPKGSTVICAQCFVPLFILERGIAPGEKASRSTDAYRPVSPTRLETLRREVPSVRAALKTWTHDDVTAHCQRLESPRTGTPAVCPSCQKSFVQVFAPDEQEVLDRAYTWRLVTIPPLSEAFPVRSSDVRL